MATRAGRPDNWHFAAAAVTTPAGDLVALLGDPEVEVFLRSGAKPFQAMPFVAAGGCESYALEPADLAMMCASHSGADEANTRRGTVAAMGASERCHDNSTQEPPEKAIS